jgi:von Willebrand factor type A domain-containing protein
MNRIAGLIGACVLAVGVAVSAASCEDGASSVFPSNAVCDNELAGQCGNPCASDAECPPGQYCAGGACTADCIPGDARCGNGVCDEHGHCSGLGQGGTGGSTMTSSGGNGATGGACGSVEVTFETVTPTVVLLIDQSGSMTADFNGQGTRWDVVYDVLMNPNGGVVKSLEANVRFGLVLYSYTTGTCPTLAELMPPALNNHAAIDAVYAPEVPLDDTPTGDSITAITPEIAAFNEPGPKLILLATDGDPDSCEDPDSNGTQPPKDEATDAAQAAFAQDISTVIVAVGDQVNAFHQQDMANAGSGKPVPAPANCDPVADPMNCAQTYQPVSKQELIDSLFDIINGQRTCVFTLDGEVISGKECDGVVMVNGVAIPCNDPNGWKLNSPNEIEFVGTACDTIMNDPDVEVSATFPCDSIVPPPQ